MGKVVVDQGALQMALNVLRRAGKDDVADELESATSDFPELPEEGAYIIRYDDAEMKDVDIMGYGARAAALRYYEKVGINWNAHLFVKVDSNTRDHEKRIPSFKVADIRRYGHANPSQDEATTYR